MRIILYVFILLTLISCSSRNIENFIDKGMESMSGNKPPSYFVITDVQTMRDYTFNMKGYTIAMPSAKVRDFSNKGKWEVLTHYSKDITLYPYPMDFYHIVVSTNHKADDMREDEYQYLQMNEAYFKKKYPRRVMRDGMIHSIDRHLEQHGKENYICDVSEALEKKWNRKLINYECYKINKQKGKYRSVTITLTYSKPINPILAQEYTYEDLKERAKRMLDSLVIKGDW